MIVFIIHGHSLMGRKEEETMGHPSSSLFGEERISPIAYAAVQR